jgi:hypothetical protein
MSAKKIIARRKFTNVTAQRVNLHIDQMTQQNWQGKVSNLLLGIKHADEAMNQLCSRNVQTECKDWRT